MFYTEEELLYLKCKDQYYTDGSSELTDAEFDALEKSLKESGSKVFGIVGTKSIISKTDTYEHPTKMLSLEKLQVVNDDDLFEEPEFFKRLLEWMRKSDEIEFTPKYDGNAINIIYKNGNLHKILTRGDGEMGADKTNKLKYIVPNKINLPGTVEIRGESVLPLSIFKEKYIKEGEVKNARNTLAGLLGTDDLSMDKILDTKFLAYHLTSKDVKGNVTFPNNTMVNLSMLGFNKTYDVQTHYIQTTGKTDSELIEEFTKIYNIYKSYREEQSDILLDGIVLKYMESDRNKFGNTSHHPRWALSIKFETEKVSTKILDVKWQLGTTGELTPVAILEPVELLGTVVKKASLYNLGKMMEKGMFPGAEVLIRKSGEIIPQVIAVLKPSPDSEEYLKQIEKLT